MALTSRASQPAFIEGDRRRVIQVLNNLVSNAIKFTEPGGQVEVAVASDAMDARLVVRDSGCGIGAEFLPHVFERMRQEDSSTTRKAGGLGLGLAIVKGIVDLHHGSVKARSEGPGQGSEFEITFPRAEATEVISKDVSVNDLDDTVVELMGKRVLLVDDEPGAREVAQVALSSLGAEVRVASSGTEALGMLKTNKFDVMVSDLGMPFMDGLTLIRTVRQTVPPSELPAVALTAFALESDRQAALQAGFQGFVTKPISLRRLSEAVAQAVN